MSLRNTAFAPAIRFCAASLWSHVEVALSDVRTVFVLRFGRASMKKEPVLFDVPLAVTFIASSLSFNS